MGEVIQFPLREASPKDLAVDLVTLCGIRLGVLLTEWNEIAVFVEHEGAPVGGLLTLEQALKLRAALTTMLSAGGYPFGSGSAE